MNFRSHIRNGFISLASMLIGVGCVIAADAKDQSLPNIVFIIADDLGYGDLGSYGSDDIRTPALDQLATEGTRLTRFYTNGSECSPTRTAILTGRYQHRVGGLECAIGIGNVGRYPQAKYLSDKGRLGFPTEFSVIPDMFKEAGYTTALIGKWHLGDSPEFGPLAHGFDYFFGPIGAAVDYFHHTEPAGIFLGTPAEGRHDLFLNDERIHHDGEYLTTLFSEVAVDWIENKREKDKPFFLYLPYTAPHTPYQGPDDYEPTPKTSENWNTGTREIYRTMVESLDSGIEQILLALDEAGLSENTLIVFTSDNGPTGRGDTRGLRGIKGQLFEGGIRVPCIVRWPGKMPENFTFNQVTMGMDFTKSFAKIVNYAPEQPFDGIDILSQMTPDYKATDRTLFWRKQRSPTKYRAVRHGELKYLHLIKRNGIEEYLFNLSIDPGESNNLLESDPESAQFLKELLSEWEGEVHPQRSDLVNYVEPEM